MINKINPESIFRQETLAMSAYHVADADGMIKLDAMENPYSWPDAILDQWLEKLRYCPLNRYPDPASNNLLETIRKLDGIPDSHTLLAGNGSDEIIQLLLMALPAEATVLAPEPTFVMYHQTAQCLGLTFQGVPLNPENFDLDLRAMLNSINRHQPAIIFLAYPNNPTGNLFSPEIIHHILEIAPGLVILDEAYAPFAESSFIEYLNDYGNLMVMRTVSKLGLAGLRLGYIAGLPEIVEQLNKIRLPYNINTLTQISAEFALSNKAMFDDQTRKICSERAVMFNELNSLEGIKAYPSVANFILFRSPSGSASQIFRNLKEQGILIKNTSTQGGVLIDTLRVTIGKPQENKAFITALRNFLRND